jgi:hypothetical protein
LVAVSLTATNSLNLPVNLLGVLRRGQSMEHADEMASSRHELT